MSWSHLGWLWGPMGLTGHSGFISFLSSVHETFT